MKLQRGSQWDRHPMGKEEEPFLDIEKAQPSPSVWHIAGAAQASWNAYHDRLARPEREASKAFALADRSKPSVGSAASLVQADAEAFTTGD